MTKMSAPTAKTVTATLTAAELLSGFITANQGAAGAATYTTPTGTQIEALLPAALATDDSFILTIINISTNAAEIVTLAAGSGVSLVGNVTIAPNSSTTTVSTARFQFRRTAANTFIGYRL